MGDMLSGFVTCFVHDIFRQIADKFTRRLFDWIGFWDHLQDEVLKLSGIAIVWHDPNTKSFAMITDATIPDIAVSGCRSGKFQWLDPSENGKSMQSSLNASGIGVSIDH